MLSRRVLNIYFDVLFQFPFRNIFATIANRVTPAIRIYSKCMRNFLPGFLSFDKRNLILFVRIFFD